MSKLPHGWIVVPIDTITTKPTQKIPKDNEEFSYIDIGSIDRETKRISDPQKVLGKDAPSRARQLVNTGDVLVSMTRPNLNAVALVPDSLDGQIASTGFDVLRPVKIEPRYLFASVRTKNFVDAMSELVQGALYPAVRPRDIREYEIPLAPLAEQKRITDKLDTLLARIESTRARLGRIPVLLKRFRQSVLAAATSGALTEEWRNGMATNWQEKPIGEVGKVQLGRQRAPKFHSGKTMRPYLRVQNVFEDRLDLSDVMEMDFSGEDLARYTLHPGDILLNEGQSPQFLGRPAMYRGEMPGVCFTNSLIRFQANLELVLPEFALIVFRYHMHSSRYVDEGTITTNIAHLSAGRFSKVEFPIPPIEEQREIVRRVESLLAISDRIQKQYKAAKAKVDRLTPALLAKAFRGELAPQDPNDEPAEKLLQRLRSSKTEGKKPVAKRGRKTKAA